MRYLKYILFLTSLAAFIGCKNKRFDTRFTHSTSSTNPYDIKFFYEQIADSSNTKVVIENQNIWVNDVIEAADIFYDTTEEDSDFEDSTSYVVNDSMQTYMVVSKYFDPYSTEIHELKNFVAEGNLAFISSFNIGQELRDSLLFFVQHEYNEEYFPPMLVEDSLTIHWIGDSAVQNFTYPGHIALSPSLDSATLFSDIQSIRVSSFDTLLLEENGEPILLKLHIGKGNLYLCSNPLILSNYFLLHKDNYELVNILYKELELGKRTLIWDNFYNRKLNTTSPSDNTSTIWTLINQYKGLKYAFYTILISVLLYFLMYSRRITQEIPIIPKRQNVSLSFVKTLAGVYWKRSDDTAIAQKLFHQFYEFCYLNYQLNAKDFDELSIEKVAKKMGKSPDVLRQVIEALKDYNSSKTITKGQLNKYYQYLSLFYKS